MILAGRRLNDNMGSYVADQVTKLMTQKRIHVVDAKILIMGLTFKEDCPDIRNTRVIDLAGQFNSYNCQVDVYDPWVDKQEVEEEYSITPITDQQLLPTNYYDAVILAVAHNQFKSMSENDFRKLGKQNHILYDIKYLLKPEQVDGRL